MHGVLRPGEQPPPWLPEAVVLHEADLLDDALGDLVAAVAPDELYNLAGVSSVAQSWEDPVLTARVNAEVVARLLEACRQAGARFLQASSAEVFAGSGACPQDESTPLVPLNPYGAAKAFAHHLVHVYRARGVHAVNVVLYNHESPRRPLTFVTRKITHAAARIAAGSTEPLALGNLDARRDWGWAPEYVDGMVRALRHGTPEDFVLASGQERSVADFVALAFAHAGVEDWQAHVRVDEQFLRPAEAPRLVGDAGKAERVLGWRATVPLEEIVARMVDAEDALSP